MIFFNIPFTHLLSPDGHGYTDSHNPEEPGEHEVSHAQTVPRGVLEEPVHTATVVYENHNRQTLGKINFYLIFI